MGHDHPYGHTLEYDILVAESNRIGQQGEKLELLFAK